MYACSPAQPAAQHPSGSRTVKMGPKHNEDGSSQEPQTAAATTAPVTEPGPCCRQTSKQLQPGLSSGCRGIMGTQHGNACSWHSPCLCVQLFAQLKAMPRPSGKVECWL